MLSFLDIMMPGKSGIELLNDIMAAYPDIAPIMISAVSNSDIAITCMKQGAYDYILKPFNTKEVLLRIEYALVKRKLIAENSDYRKRLEQIVGEQAGEIRPRRKISGILWIIHRWGFVSSLRMVKQLMPTGLFWTFMVIPLPQK